MNRLVIVLVCWLGGMAQAQEGVVPKGMGSVEGNTNGEAWTASKTRHVLMIDRAQFPWGAGNTGVVQGFRLRRTSLLGFDTTSEQKPVRVKVSSTRLSTDVGSTTPTGPTAAETVGAMAEVGGGTGTAPSMDSLLGAAPVTSFASQSSVHPFLLAAAPPTSYQVFAMPFDIAITFANPVPVPADADTLVLDIAVETTAQPGNGEVTYTPIELGRETFPGPFIAEFRGGFRKIGSPCTTTGPNGCGDGVRSAPCMDRCTARGMFVGGTFETRAAAGTRPGVTEDLPGLMWIGYLEPAPLPLPNSPCSYQVGPFTYAFLTFFNGSDYVESHSWGQVPANPGLVGATFGMQFATFAGASGSNPYHTVGHAVSAAYEVTIGPVSTGAVQYTAISKACDDSGNIFGLPPCIDVSTGLPIAANSPFTAGATGAVGPMPVLQLF